MIICYIIVLNIRWMKSMWVLSWKPFRIERLKSLTWVLFRGVLAGQGCLWPAPQGWYYNYLFLGYAYPSLLFYELNDWSFLFIYFYTYIETHAFLLLDGLVFDLFMKTCVFSHVQFVMLLVCIFCYFLKANAYGWNCSMK